jgi:hypothetical protein
VQVSNTAITLRPVVTTEPFISCGWLVLGTRGQQIQLSVTSLNLTPCTSLRNNSTTATNCSCSYLEVCSYCISSQMCHNFSLLHFSFEIDLFYRMIVKSYNPF